MRERPRARSRAKAGQLLRAAELTKDEYARLAPRRVFVLPLGILEAHGPHLPLGTDSFQVESVVGVAARKTGAVVLPTLWYGNTNSTRPFPGSISISVDTLRAILGDILSELARHGVRRLVIISGHAGSAHMAGVRLAVREFLDERPAMTIAVLSEWDPLLALSGTEVAGAKVPAFDGHAGTMETARMLALSPALVGRPPKAHEAADQPYLMPLDPGAAMPDAYGGAPRLATPRLGRALHQRCVDELVRVIGSLETPP